MPDNQPEINPLFTQNIVYNLPYDGAISEDVCYGTESQVMDIYAPSDAEGPLPAVLFVTGFPASGFAQMMGIQQKKVHQYTSWAKLVAACGMIAVTYSADDPVNDLKDLIGYLQEQGNALGINRGALAVWSCSSNVPNAIHALSSTNAFRCAVLCYGFMLDLGSSTAVADAQKQFRFANPNSGEANFPSETPLLIVRAGKDEFATLNQTIDDFVAEGLKRNCPLSLINYTEAEHGFDIKQDTPETINILKAILAFLSSHLKDS